MKTKEKKRFNELYERHLNLLKLHGMQPKTIEAYARGVRRVPSNTTFNHNSRS